MSYLKTKTDLNTRNRFTSALTFVLICAVIIIVYFSFLSDRLLGLISIVISVIIVLLAYTNDVEAIYKVIPSAALSVLSLILLFASGRRAERGYWAPIFYAYKYNYLFLAHSIYVSMRHFSKKQKRIIFYATIACTIITAFYSLYYVINVDEYAMRNGQYHGVADFSHVYGIVFISIILFTALVNSNYSFSRILLLFSFAVCSVCILFSLFTTAIFLLIFGVIFSFLVFVYEKHGPYIGVFVTLILLLLICVIFLFSQEISDWIFYKTEGLNWVVRARIRSVADSLFNTNHNLRGYNSDRRNELAQYSLKSFFEHPLLGVGYSGYRYGTIGNHQEWADMLGVFGLIGSTGIISVLVIIIAQIINDIKHRVDYICFVLALLFFVLFGFLNPIFNPQVLSAVFVLAPNVSSICFKQEQ